MDSGKKKICLIMGSHWSAIMGGAQYQAKCIVNALISRDEYEIFYLARRISPTYQPIGYHVHQISAKSRRRGSSFLLDSVDLIKLIRSIRPDIVYQRALQPYTGIAAYAAKTVDAKFIFHIAHDYDVLPMEGKSWSPKFIISRIERVISEYGLRNADYVVAQTNNQASFLKKNYGRAPSAIIPNFHPFPKEEITKPKNPIRVVWVANFKQTKQPELFVDLAESMSYRKDVEFIMVGRSGDSQLYGELHERISKTKNLIYRGELPIDEVNSLLASAHIFVNTSIAEGFPNTFIQAWMRKVPVVSLRVTVDDALDDQRIGVLAGSYEQLRNSVIRLIDDPELCKVMGEFAQKYAFERYSDRNVESLISIIKKI